MKKICVFTGTRAEYGLLSTLMRLIKDDSDCELITVVTGSHLSSEFGETYKEIEADGFKIDAKADILRFDDTREGMAKSVGLAVSLFTDILSELKPDIAVILGDRYEMLAAAETCFLLNIPVAHIHGGEITEGAIDDIIRHCITKLSRLHFTSTEAYRTRVIQLGEHPHTVHNVGAIGLEAVMNSELMTHDEIKDFYGIKDWDKIILVTCHPETNDTEDVKMRFQEVLDGLEKGTHGLQTKIVFTGANADPGGREIDAMAQEFCEKSGGHAVFYKSLGYKRYLSTMKYSSCVLGNSSSGIIEAPSFHVHTINIGDRQKGRVAAKSVINCGYNAEIIAEKLKLILNEGNDCLKGLKNPYEKAGTAENMLYIIKTSPDMRNMPKKFYDISNQ